MTKDKFDTNSILKRATITNQQGELVGKHKDLANVIEKEMANLYYIADVGQKLRPLEEFSCWVQDLLPSHWWIIC
jgi:hypothetical protein